MTKSKTITNSNWENNECVTWRFTLCVMWHCAVGWESLMFWRIVMPLSSGSSSLRTLLALHHIPQDFNLQQHSSHNMLPTFSIGALSHRDIPQFLHGSRGTTRSRVTVLLLQWPHLKNLLNVFTSCSLCNSDLHSSEGPKAVYLHWKQQFYKKHILRCSRQTFPNTSLH